MSTIISPNISSPSIPSLGISATGVSLTKALAIGAALALLLLTIGAAIAERIEQRAAGDRLHMGELKYGESGMAIIAARQE